MTTSVAEWKQLDRNTLPVTALWIAGILAGIAVPILIGVLNNDGPFGVVLLIALGGIVVGTGIATLVDLMRWRHTTYRVTDERVELRYAWIVHKLRSVPRERVRTVDLAADPVQRLFGVVKVKIGTGQQATGTNSHLALDPVSRAAAEELRRVLLRHAEEPATGEAPAASRPLAVLDWAWLRNAPIAVTTPILGAAAFGGVMQVSEWFGAQGAVFRAVRDLFGGLSILQLIAVFVVTGVIVGVIGSLGFWVEMWWNYRLTREHGALRVQRGLFTTRSLSLEQRRLRGVDVFEALGTRLVGAARVDVIATGMKADLESEKSDPKTLLPAAPMALAQRVAVDVLGADPLTDVDIRPHPRAARGRRLRWAAYAVLALVAVLVVLGLLLTTVLLHIAWISAVVATPVVIALALDDYRNLGHGLSGDYLVSRYGAGSRHTIALVRSGVIGWTVRRSPFQRRAGLITLSATTAASKGEYFVRDVGEAEGLAFAEEAVPGLLTPFLEEVSEHRGDNRVAADRV
jgi:putative membrane protein